MSVQNYKNRIDEVVTTNGQRAIKGVDLNEVLQLGADAMQEVADQANAGITGFAKQDNQPLYDSVTYPNGLVEKWEVVEPIDNTSDWYDLATTEERLKFPITQTNLDENKVYFNVTNGVVAVQLSAKISFANGSVTPEKTTFVKNEIVPIGKNVLNPDLLRLNESAIPSTGGFQYDSGANTFRYIPIKRDMFYSFKNVYSVVWYDEDLVFISHQVISIEYYESPSNARYMACTYFNSNVPMAEEGQNLDVQYEPFSGIEVTKIKNLYIDLLQKENEVLRLGDASTNALKIGGIVVYYEDKENYNYYIAGAGNLNGDYSDYIAANSYGNTAGGHLALTKAKNALMMTCFGYRAGEELEEGADHAFFGAGAGQKQKGGVGCAGFGRLSGANSVWATNWSAYGDTSLEYNVEGDSQNAFGYSSGIQSGGDNNCFFGTFAGGHILGKLKPTVSTFTRCNVFGNGTMQRNDIHHRNNLFGTEAGQNLEGEDNAGFGDSTLKYGTDINRNTTIGNFSADNLDEGNDNFFGGYNAKLASSLNGKVSGVTAIGANIRVTRDNEIVIGKNTDTHLTVAGIEFTKAQLIALKGLVS